MTTLLLDIGNSRLKWVAVSHWDAPLPAVAALPHAGDPAATLAQLAANWQGPRPQSLCIAHVTGAMHEAALIVAAQQGFGLSPHLARSSAECGGLKSAYADPARLGVDRWLAMLALWHAGQRAFCVASAGTALTFDAVSDSGQHEGGVIAPGLTAMIDATLGNTRFAVGELAAAFSPGLGRDTEACVRQGALHAAAGLLDRLSAPYSQRVLCGGDAEQLHGHLASRWQVQPTLVLRGLAVWARLASG